MNSDKDALILIVDDNVHNLQVIGNILRKDGFKTAVAQNGKQAVEFVKKKKTDLILMDVMMPEMDGYTACRRILENESTNDIPIIFLTALSDMDSKIKGFESGGVDYIAKPFMKEEVLARVGVHIKLKKTLEKLQNTS